MAASVLLLVAAVVTISIPGAFAGLGLDVSSVSSSACWLETAFRHTSLQGSSQWNALDGKLVADGSFIGVSMLAIAGSSKTNTRL
jgi:Trk-type K+ transport system membrane component